jgi:lysophospholipase L1-like esterase
MRWVQNIREGSKTGLELVRAMWRGPYWWLVPVVLILLPSALIFVFLQAMPLVAPFVFTLLAPLVGLGLAEVVVRVFHLEPLPQPRAQGALQRDHPDPTIRFENNPGAELRITYVTHSGAAPLEVVARVNEQGWRGPLMSVPKSPGVVRIACVGDSHTFGYGVGEGETWPDALSAELERRLGPGRVEVLNCGVCAYDTEQEVGLLEARILALEPDIVLLQFYLNDPALRDTPAEPTAENDWLISLCHPRGPGVMRFLRAHSHFVDLAATNVFRRRYMANFSRTRSALFAEGLPGWIRCRAALTRAQADLERAGVGFALVLFPFLLREGEHLASHDAFEIVARFCHAQALECWDLEPAFDGRDVDALRVHPLDFHANPEAYRIFGTAVAEKLLGSALAARLGPR